MNWTTCYYKQIETKYYKGKGIKDIMEIIKCMKAGCRKTPKLIKTGKEFLFYECGCKTEFQIPKNVKKNKKC